LPRQTQNFSCNGALRMGLLSEVVDLWQWALILEQFESIRLSLLFTNST
jgi:hypothetical protein